MTAADLTDLVAYSEWATDRLFACAETLDADAWARDLGGSIPSLGGTFAHIVGSEWLWLLRWNQEEPTAPPTWVVDPTPGGTRSRMSSDAAPRSSPPTTSTSL